MIPSPDLFSGRIKGMEAGEQKVSAYGGLVNVTKRQYILIQSAVFAVLGTLFLLTFFYDLDRIFFGNARLAIGVVVVLEVAEMVYIFRRFN